MSLDDIAYLLITLLGGIALGILGYWIFHRTKVGGYQKLVNQMMHKAETDADAVRKMADLSIKQQQVEQQREFERLLQIERRKLQKEEERLKQREDKLESRMNLLESKLSDTEQKEREIAREKERLEIEWQNIKGQQSQLIVELEQATGLSATEAKELIINKLTNEVKTEAANLIRKVKKEAEEEAEKEAARIIATSINRLAGSCVSEITVSTVAIPNEEMKGRVIGREGRNIKTLERATGINFIIDDTPGVVVLSGFDPIRMHIAKVALADLLLDGRIHPTRIEEVVEKTTVNVHKQIHMYGEDAALRAGAMDLHPELITLLGKLKFRFSYGQNILEHSLEVSHLLGMMAAELGLNVSLAKRIGLLHDIGKAVTHEVEGSHALIGYDFAIKYGESKDVANGIGCHHQEMEPVTIEGSLCSAADTLSASRPGARIEAVEEYVKRLKRLEDLAHEFEGVEKAYAMQAGREIRIIVSPHILDDNATVALTRDLTKRIEEELRYPGKIKVTVIREKRVVEYAL